MAWDAAWVDQNNGKSWLGEGIDSHPSRWDCEGWGTRAVLAGWGRFALAHECPP